MAIPTRQEIQPVSLADSSGVATLGTALIPSANVLTTQRPPVTQVISTALEASHILKGAAGQLVSLTVFNSKASAQFILILNAATLTADGAVTLWNSASVDVTVVYIQL